MASAVRDSVTRYLARIRAGDATAVDDLMPLIYDELRALARRLLAQELDGYAFDATSLVHEVFLRLVDEHTTDLQSRGHFLRLAAKAMRQLLIDHARARRAEKRGGGRARVELKSGDAVVDFDVDEWLDLDEALHKLHVLDERQAQVVELHFFGGQSFDEIAELLDVSSKTVSREWKAARAWLSATLHRGNGVDGQRCG